MSMSGPTEAVCTKLGHGNSNGQLKVVARRREALRTAEAETKARG